MRSRHDTVNRSVIANTRARGSASTPRGKTPGRRVVQTSRRVWTYSPQTRGEPTVEHPREPATRTRTTAWPHTQSARTPSVHRPGALPAPLAPTHGSPPTAANTTVCSVRHSSTAGHHAHGARTPPHPLGPKGAMCGRAPLQLRGQDKAVQCNLTITTSMSIGTSTPRRVPLAPPPPGHERRYTQREQMFDIETSTSATLTTGEWVQSSVRLLACHGQPRHLVAMPRNLVASVTAHTPPSAAARGSRRRHRTPLQVWRR